MKKVLVTGASGEIGKQVTKDLLERGYKVVAHSSSDASSSRLRESLESNPLSENMEYCVCDLSDHAAVESFCKEFGKKNKDLYGVVNNAGVTNDGPLMMQSRSKIEQTMAVNLFAPIMISKMASKIFMKNKSGSLVNISSVVGEVGNPMQCIYSTTKAGLLGLTKSMAKEMCMMTKTDQVRVNAVAPGFIQSKMTDAIPEEFAEKMREKIPLARVGTSKEVSSVVCFLLSKEASYITGTVFDVNGGML